MQSDAALESLVDAQLHGCSEQYRAGAISEGDLLKIKLQLLQFQQDVAQARLARVQALVGLRQLLGYESVPADYDVAGAFAAQRELHLAGQLFVMERLADDVGVIDASESAAIGKAGHEKDR